MDIKKFVKSKYEGGGQLKKKLGLRAVVTLKNYLILKI